MFSRDLRKELLNGLKDFEKKTKNNLKLFHIAGDLNLNSLLRNVVKWSNTL